MKKLLAASGAAFLLLAALCFTPAVKGTTAYATLYSVWVKSSLIDSTPVGANTPSTGAFTSLVSTSGAINGSIGATTPSTGAFTTVSASGLAGPLTGTVGATSPASGAFTSVAVSGFGSNSAPVCNTSGTLTNAGCVAQTNVTGSRAFGTVYTNGATPIMVEATLNTLSSSGCAGSNVFLSGLSGATSGTLSTVSANGIWNECQGVASVSVIVPAGYSYEVTYTVFTGGPPSSAVLANWTEVTI